MTGILFVMCLLVLLLAVILMFEAKNALQRSKELMYFVYDWLEELKQDRCHCERED